MTVIEPIDETHRDCLRARDDIRRIVDTLRYHASLWRPEPMPANYRPTRGDLQ